MKDARKLKGLVSQLKKMEGDAEALKIEVQNKQREYSSKLRAIETIKEQINKLEKQNGVIVTEHAILRYLERVKGINLADISKEILTDEIKKFVAVIGGNGTYPNNGFSVKIVDYKIVTVI